MNFILQISSKCGQGGRGSKNPKILRMSLMDAPLYEERGREKTLLHGETKLGVSGEIYKAN